MLTTFKFSSTLLFCTLILFATLSCLQPLLAQKPSPRPAPKYDLQTEVTLKGTVLEIKPAENEKDNIHLMLKITDETIDISLCPKSFLTDMATSFAKGDEISLTGSKVKLESASLVLAREVVKGNDKLLLRDAKGAPVWNWKH